MKRWFILSFLSITILACSFLSSILGSTPTPKVEIVFRSPGDVNLQPEDVPDLEEAPVEDPAQ